MKPQLRPPCSPDLTNFKHSSLCRPEQQRLWLSKRTTNNRSTKDANSSRGGFPNG